MFPRRLALSSLHSGGREDSIVTSKEANRAIKKGDALLLRRELGLGLDPILSNELSWTLLMVAAMSGDTSIGILLLDHGADANKRNKFGDTALSLAAHRPSFLRATFIGSRSFFGRLPIREIIRGLLGLGCEIWDRAFPSNEENENNCWCCANQRFRRKEVIVHPLP